MISEETKNEIAMAFVLVTWVILGIWWLSLAISILLDVDKQGTHIFLN